MSIIRWVLVLPSTVAAHVAAYLLGLVIWNAVRYINIVPQNDAISTSLASAGICLAAAAAGVAAGGATAPGHKQPVAWALCALSSFVALLLLGDIDISGIIRAQIPLYWRLIMMGGWIAGAILAARAFAEKPHDDDNNHPMNSWYNWDPK